MFVTATLVQIGCRLLYINIPGFLPLKRRRLSGIGNTIINLRQSDCRLSFIYPHIYKTVFPYWIDALSIDCVVGVPGTIPLLTLSAFWSLSRWLLATPTSSRRQRSIPLGGRYRQVQLYKTYKTEYLRTRDTTGFGGSYRSVLSWCQDM